VFPGGGVGAAEGRGGRTAAGGHQQAHQRGRRAHQAGGT